MSVFGLRKKPSDRIKELFSEGKNKVEVIRKMKYEGYNPDQVEKGMIEVLEELEKKEMDSEAEAKGKERKGKEAKELEKVKEKEAERKVKEAEKLKEAEEKAKEKEKEAKEAEKVRLKEEKEKAKEAERKLKEKANEEAKEEAEKVRLKEEAERAKELEKAKIEEEEVKELEKEPEPEKHVIKIKPPKYVEHEHHESAKPHREPRSETPPEVAHLATRKDLERIKTDTQELYDYLKVLREQIKENTEKISGIEKGVSSESRDLQKDFKQLEKSQSMVINEDLAEVYVNIQKMNERIHENLREVTKRIDDFELKAKSIKELAERLDKNQKEVEDVDIKDMRRDIEVLKQKMDWIEEGIDKINVKPIFERIEEIEHMMQTFKVSNPVIIE
jgi:hypothetical protein